MQHPKYNSDFSIPAYFATLSRWYVFTTIQYKIGGKYMYLPPMYVRQNCASTIFFTRGKVNSQLF